MALLRRFIPYKLYSLPIYTTGLTYCCREEAQKANEVENRHPKYSRPKDFNLRLTKGMSRTRI